MRIGCMVIGPGGAMMRTFVLNCPYKLTWDGAVRATDVWLRLMMAPQSSPFPASAVAPAAQPQGLVAVCRPGACLLYNE